MSDKNVFAWNPYRDDRGLPLGSQVAGKNIRENLFMIGLPVGNAYEKWLAFKGVQSALKGTHKSARKEYTDEVKRTIEWMKHKPPLQYAISASDAMLAALSGVRNISKNHNDLPFILREPQAKVIYQKVDKYFSWVKLVLNHQ